MIDEPDQAILLWLNNDVEDYEAKASYRHLQIIARIIKRDYSDRLRLIYWPPLGRSKFDLAELCCSFNDNDSTTRDEVLAVLKEAQIVDDYWKQVKGHE